MNKVAPVYEELDRLFAEADKKEPSAIDYLTRPVEEEKELVVITKKLLTPKDPEVIDQNIDQGIRTLREVAGDTDARGSDRITAAKALLESAGLLGKGSTVNFVKAENAQINNTSSEDQKLLTALGQIGNLLDATDAKINIHDGGKGV